MNSLQRLGSPRWSQTKPRFKNRRAFISLISRADTVAVFTKGKMTHVHVQVTNIIKLHSH